MWMIQFLDKYRLELLARQSEIRSLQAQVEPHFLMNTLNAVKQLIRTDPEQARAYVVKLGHFFRATREQAAATSVTLEQELSYGRDTSHEAPPVQIRASGVTAHGSCLG